MRDPVRVKAFLARWKTWYGSRYRNPPPRFTSREFWLLGSILNKLDVAAQKTSGVSGRYGEDLAERMWTAAADCGVVMDISTFIRSYVGLAAKIGLNPRFVASPKPKTPKEAINARN